MNKHLRIILTILAFATFMIVAYFAYSALTASNSVQLKKEAEPVAAAEFTVFNEEGDPVKLSDFEGKPIILNFWATWCPYCRKEMPYFQKAYEEYGDEISFLMINSTDGQRETVEMAKEFIEENQYTFPVLYDINGEATYSYKASSLPTTVCINKDMNIVIYQPGLMTEDMLKEAISLLKE